jgi:NAD(P)H-quinone oxidoreductase subunit 5
LTQFKTRNMFRINPSGGRTMPLSAVINPALALGAILLALSGLIGSIKIRSRFVDHRSIALVASAAAACLALCLAAAVLFRLPVGVWKASASGVSALFACTVTFLAFTIFKVSWRSLYRDPAEARFYRYAQLTLACILGIAASGSLYGSIAFWCLSGVPVHRLLTLYPERKRAHYAARKKIYANRVGNGLGVLACAFLLAQGGAMGWPDMGNVLVGHSWGWAPAVLIALAALVKSAQVPFQTWLPETLEAPTPVSALLHAGVLNAGGFILLQSWSLLAGVPAAREVLCVIGALTVVSSGLTMITAPDQKRRLAHSTSAQIGFMMVQVGLGVPEAALLHMVGHALYKAHAFLTSSRLQPQGMQPEMRSMHLGPRLGTGFLVLVLGLSPIWAHATGFIAATSFSRCVASSLLCTAALSGIWLTSEHLRGERVAAFVFTLLIVAGAALTIWGGQALSLLPELNQLAAPLGSPSWVVCLAVWASFATLFTVQTVMPWMNAHRHFTSVFITLKNGFYVETLWRRVMRPWQQIS